MTYWLVVALVVIAAGLAFGFLRLFFKFAMWGMDDKK